MNSKRYAEEFKIEAVKQITERRYPVAEKQYFSRLESV
jgi:transposase